MASGEGIEVEENGQAFLPLPPVEYRVVAFDFGIKRNILRQLRQHGFGVRVVPAMPAFYHRPQTIDDIINQTVNRVLDLFDIELPEDLFNRWQGPAYGPADRRE